MIKDFLILNFIGKENKIGLRIKNSFYVHDFDKKTDNDQLVLSVLNIIKKYKVNIDMNFTVLVNIGPGSFSSLRSSLAVAKGIRISKKTNLFGYKNSDLSQFTVENIDLLIKKNLVQKNLIKPIYLS
tara:strand:- start:701 stop:1081 length:381 start_codon:yes stop_codon:yes gene_type:complete